MRYQIISSILLVILSAIAVWIKINALADLRISETGHILISNSLLLIPVASTTGISMGWFFYILESISKENSRFLNSVQMNILSKVSFWIPPLAPTITTILSFTI
jgi:hypothetical protein